MAKMIPCTDGTMADPSIGCVEPPATIVNPDSGVLQVILHVAEGLMTLVTAVATIALIYGALHYMTNASNEMEIEKSKSIMFWSLFGLVVALISKFVVFEAIKIIS